MFSTLGHIVMSIRGGAHKRITVEVVTTRVEFAQENFFRQNFTRRPSNVTLDKQAVNSSISRTGSSTCGFQCSMIIAMAVVWMMQSVFD
jgi:hypothetical protein